jgi:hypothetical protein
MWLIGLAVVLAVSLVLVPLAAKAQPLPKAHCGLRPPKRAPEPYGERLFVEAGGLVSYAPSFMSDQ